MNFNLHVFSFAQTKTPMSSFLNQFTSNSEYRCTVETEKKKKKTLSRAFCFYIAHAARSKIIFLLYPRYLPTDFDAVTDYVSE